MAKTKLAPAPAAKQDSVPLEALTISWTQRGYYGGSPDQAVTITGKQLTRLLVWASRTPVRMDTHGDVVTDLMGISEILQALGRADFTSRDFDENAAFAFLGDLTQDLVARLRAFEEPGYFKPTVTIGTPAVKAGA
jgi:hypothetical protein